METVLDRRRSLRRKLNKFRNKGGTVDVICGAMPPAVLDEAMACYATLKPLALLPFQDHYVAMSAATASVPTDRLVAAVRGAMRLVIGRSTVRPGTSAAFTGIEVAADE